mmetsp:Transcript_44619/g.78430  ORF Transcript_44619/g.78430 Transcript_44619/m.78430 type:complete len:250 (-) Transcript_44619:177-926(-)
MAIWQNSIMEAQNLPVSFASIESQNSFCHIFLVQSKNSLNKARHRSTPNNSFAVPALSPSQKNCDVNGQIPVPHELIRMPWTASLSELRPSIGSFKSMAAQRLCTHSKRMTRMTTTGTRPQNIMVSVGIEADIRMPPSPSSSAMPLSFTVLLSPVALLLAFATLGTTLSVSLSVSGPWPDEGAGDGSGVAFDFDGPGAPVPCAALCVRMCTSLTRWAVPPSVTARRTCSSAGFLRAGIGRTQLSFRKSR